MRPRYLAQEGQIQKIAGTRHAIGGFQKNTEWIFEKHSFDLSQGAVCYLFSDGYEDQIGGDTQKKCMTARFRAHLQEVHHLPCQTQKQQLEDTSKNDREASPK
ncbi:SpoIIE family protein phosphatase [Eisenibacter elegans]|uniref:SpoIIE family protein phosphatase n=1 Tax=Eisenibacter elegans TaxID=997 RepID=UPI000429676A|nr:SpoIIE family protein phosphatase [Eisenibacter elegans]